MTDGKQQIPPPAPVELIRASPRKSVVAWGPGSLEFVIGWSGGFLLCCFAGIAWCMKAKPVQRATVSAPKGMLMAAIVVAVVCVILFGRGRPVEWAILGRSLVVSTLVGLVFAVVFVTMFAKFFLPPT